MSSPAVRDETGELPGPDGLVGVPRPMADMASELLPDGLVVAEGPTGLVRHVNAIAERITGLSSAQVVGRPLAEAFAFQDRSGCSWWEMANPWHGLATRTGHREKSLMLPNGKECLVTARYLRAGRCGPVVAVVVGLRDVEARRRAEAEHAAIISTIAHELRSPLTGVKGFSSTLLKSWDRFTDDQKRLMIETIESDADRVTRLITELLDVSRIDSGRLRIHPQPIDGPVYLRRHIERIVASGREGTEFEVAVEEGAELWADPDRLDQILANLLENAVRHARGRVSLRVEAVPGVGADLLVVDDGPGVPESARELIFSKFWHGRSHGSTGLGLYIVRGLAEAHGGSAHVETAATGGAQFRVRLPAPRET